MHLLSRWCCLLTGMLLAGCGRSAPAPTATTATAPSGPRIVSTVPAATLNLVLIGAADRLVGISKYDRLVLPQDKQNLPVIGDYETMNYEQLVALRPTALVIQQAESRIAPRLKQVAAAQHIELINMRFFRVADIWDSVRALGRISDKQAAAEMAIENAQRELKELGLLYGTTSGMAHPKVLYVASPRLMLIAGSDTFIDEMITLAGGENIGAKAGRDYVEIGREAIVKLAPDVLLVDVSEQPGEQENDPRLEPWVTLPIPAARSKRVYLVTNGNALMASVDIGKNVRMLAEMIHRGEPTPATSTAPATRGEMP